MCIPVKKIQLIFIDSEMYLYNQEYMYFFHITC